MDWVLLLVMATGIVSIGVGMARGSAVVPCGFLPCDPGPMPMGVKADPGERLTLYLPTCFTGAVKDFKVVVSRGGSDDERVLWHVWSGVPRHVDSFTIGEPPPGFVEEILVSSLPRTQEVTALVDGGVLIESFVVDDLVPGSVRYGEDDLFDEAFRSASESACRTWDEAPGNGFGWLGMLALAISVPVWFYRRSYPARRPGSMPPRPDSGVRSAG